MLRRFRLEEPESVAEVSELLGRFGDSAKVYAGGTELLLAMKEGLIHYERLINVKRLKGLGEMDARDLAQTTLDYRRRTLLKVQIDSNLEADKTFVELLGKDPASRYRFIMEKAAFAEEEELDL